GGAFVLDTRNRDQCVKSLPPEERRQFDDWTLRIENLFDAATSRWRARWFRLASSAPAPREAGELLGETDIRLYSAHELAAMLRPERWSRVDLYGGLDGTPFSLAAPRLIPAAATASASTPSTSPPPRSSASPSCTRPDRTRSRWPSTR